MPPLYSVPRREDPLVADVLTTPKRRRPADKDAADRLEKRGHKDAAARIRQAAMRATGADQLVDAAKQTGAAAKQVGQAVAAGARAVRRKARPSLELLMARGEAKDIY